MSLRPPFHCGYHYLWKVGSRPLRREYERGQRCANETATIARLASTRTGPRLIMVKCVARFLWSFSSPLYTLLALREATTPSNLCHYGTRFVVFDCLLILNSLEVAPPVLQSEFARSTIQREDCFQSSIRNSQKETLTSSISLKVNQD